MRRNGPRITPRGPDWAIVIASTFLVVMFWLIVGVAALIVFAIAQAFAADTGEFNGLPGAKEWFERDVPSYCCSFADGHRATVRSTGGHFEAFIDGTWHYVEPGRVINERSPWAFPVIWYGRDVYQQPQIHCLALPVGL